MMYHPPQFTPEPAVDQVWNPWDLREEAEEDLRMERADARRAAIRDAETTAMRFAEALISQARTTISLMKVSPKELANVIDNHRVEDAYGSNVDDVLHDLALVTRYAVDQRNNEGTWYDAPPEAIWWSCVAAMAKGEWSGAQELVDKLADMERSDARWDIVAGNVR